MLASILEASERFDLASCSHCAESLAYIVTDDLRVRYLEQLTRDDCCHYRAQRIRQVLRAIDARLVLLEWAPVSLAVH